MNNVTLTEAQRRMLHRIKTAPVGVYGPYDDRRVTKGLERRGLIDRVVGETSRSVSWRATTAGLAALTAERNNATLVLTVAQRRQLRRINEDPIRVCGPNDNQQVTAELERLGLIEQKQVPPRVEREWWITTAGVAALDSQPEGCDDPNCPIHSDRVKAEAQAELEPEPEPEPKPPVLDLGLVDKDENEDEDELPEVCDDPNCPIHGDGVKDKDAAADAAIHGTATGHSPWSVTKPWPMVNPPKGPVPWAQVVQALAALGWTVEAVQDELSRQWDEAFLASRSDEPIPPGAFIHDEGGEEPPEDEEGPSR